MTRIAGSIAIIVAAAALGISRGADSEQPATPASPAPATAAPTQHAAESKDADVGQSLREIRDDVRALRQDIEQLRELLKAAAAKNDSKGRKNADGENDSDDCDESNSATLTNGVYFFYAKSCGPCMEMRPIVGKLQREESPIVEVNIDQRPKTTKQFNIQMIPAFVLVVDGKEKDRVIGKTSESALRRLLAKTQKQLP